MARARVRGWTKRFLASSAGAFTENVGLKLVSLALAIGLVAYHRGQQDDQVRTISVDIVWQLPPETANRELMTTMRPNINVTLEGTRTELDRLVEEGVQPVELDLRDGVAERVRFGKDMFALPEDVKIKYIMPPSIELEWQDIITRQIPIQASLTGNVAPGFTAGKIDVEPTQIDVRGPRSVVDVMQFARLSAFDVSGLSVGTYRRPIAIDAPPERVDYLGPASATVTVEIKRRMIQLKFPAQEVEVVGIAASKVIPKVIDVVVTGPPEKVSALRADQVVPRADVSSLSAEVREAKHGSVAVPVVVDLAGVSAEVQPPTVTVKW